MSGKTGKGKALPKGWREVRLGEVGVIHSGGTPSTRDDSNWNGSIFWLTPSEVTKLPQKYISSTDRKITQKGLSDTTLLPEGCLIVCTRATIGDCCINTVPMTINQGFKCIQPHEVYSVTFLYYTLKSLKQQLVRLSCGNTFGEVSRKDFSNILIAVPSLPEQKTIASLLETWDTAIEKTEALIAAKEKRFKWLLKTLISDQQDNPEWRKVKLGEVFGEKILVGKGKVLTKKQMSNGNYPVVAGGQSYATFHNQFTHDAKTITISSSGAYAGFVWFHDYPIFATDCNVITAIESESIIEYFYYAIKMQQNRLYNLQSGGAQPHIYEKDIATLEILIPTVTRQRKVAHILDKARKEIDSLRGLVEQYRTQKRGLMQKLLMGEWKTSKEEFSCKT